MKTKRKSIRLAGYDYSQPGSYFVTICVNGFRHELGEIQAGIMRLNHSGEIASTGWNSLNTKYPQATVDCYTVMPNHVHAIVSIHEVVGGETPPTLGEGNSLLRPNNKPGGETLPLRITLGRIMAWYKYETTKQVNAKLGTPGQRFWQRNYYERVVRNEHELKAIYDYIVTNPANWEKDEYQGKTTKTGRGDPAPTPE